MLLASELSRVFHGLLVNPTIGPRSCEPLNSSHYSLRSTIRRAQVPPVIPMERPDAPQARELHIVIVVNSNIPSRFSTLLSWVSSTSNTHVSGLFRHDTPKLRTVLFRPCLTKYSLIILFRIEIFVQHPLQRCPTLHNGWEHPINLLQVSLHAFHMVANLLRECHQICLLQVLSYMMC